MALIESWTSNVFEQCLIWIIQVRNIVRGVHKLRNGWSLNFNNFNVLESNSSKIHYQACFCESPPMSPRTPSTDVNYNENPFRKLKVPSHPISHSLEIIYSFCQLAKLYLSRSHTKLARYAVHRHVRHSLKVVNRIVDWHNFYYKLIAFSLVSAWIDEWAIIW